MAAGPKRYVRFDDKLIGPVFIIAPGPHGELASHNDLAIAAKQHARFTGDGVPEPVSAGYFTVERVHTTEHEVIIYGRPYHGSGSLGLMPLPDDGNELSKFLGLGDRS